jgi:hypothetical protein
MILIVDINVVLLIIITHDHNRFIAQATGPNNPANNLILT